jgi:hypothetical protein
LTISGTSLGSNTAAIFGSTNPLVAVFSDPIISGNLYYNSGWKYYSSNYGAFIDLASGTFAFNNAPSGTAGGAATVTQQALIDTTGNLYLRGQVYVGGNGSSTGTQLVYNSGTWGINISGNAATVTNGLTTSNYAGYSNFSGQVNAVGPTGYTSGTKAIGSGLPFQSGSISVTQADDTFYPLISCYSVVSGQGYYNYPAFGFMRPTTNINGDVVISNRGDGLATLYWKFKPNGDLTIGGAFNGSGSGLTGTASSLSIGGSSATVTHNASRTDGTYYNVVWAAGNPSPMYSADSVQIQSSTGTLKATTLSATNIVGNSTGSYTATIGTIAASWGGNSTYPTLYGSTADRWVMHMNMHISYTQNGVNGFSGSMTGATIRMASDTAATYYWDIGPGTSGVGTDKFSIGRNASSLFNLSNGGNGVFSGSVTANQFNDSGNTTYYAQPSSYSSFWGLAIRGDQSAAGTGNQLFLYGSGGSTTSAIGFKNSPTNSSIWPSTGYGDGWNTYFTMDTSGRGWVFQSNPGGFGASTIAHYITNTGVGYFSNFVNAPNGYVSNGNPWGTANSAYFPNGITTAGNDNWIYGHTYVGNAPSNGNGHEFFTNGNQRSTGTITAGGFSGPLSGNATTATTATTSYYHYSNGIGNDGTTTEGRSATFRTESGTGGTRSYAPILHVASGDTMWQLQGMYYYQGNDIQYRAGYNNGNWQSWQTLLHSGNYSNWAMPIGGGQMNGYLTVSANWGTSPYTSALTVIGTYPSITLRGSNSDYEWLIHHSGNGYLNFYGGSGYTANNWNQFAFFSTNGSFYENYDLIAYASDRRLKHNVKSIDNALTKVNSLTGMTYEWNEVGRKWGWNPDKARHAGVFAQDVQAVLPEAVTIAPFDMGDEGESKSGENFLTVKYDKMVPLLIEAIKELNQKVEDQDKLIKSLLDR